MAYTLPEFLAHALALEQEAADRYLELADMMESYRNDPVSSVFRDMHRFSLLHRDDIRKRVGSIELPQLRSWQYRWRTPPVVGGEEAFDHTLEPYNALKYARENEVRAMQYYRAVAAEAQDVELARLAKEFADEEAGHVAALDKWIALTPSPSSTWIVEKDKRKHIDCSESDQFVEVCGGRVHNLKNIDLDLPRDKLIVITGLSGSGKSSLAFDTIYAEGQRRYVESLSAYARQFSSIMEKPDVDHIEGLSPAISIEQKSTSHNPRSTVGTITEIYDYLRLLYARAGTLRCPEHHTSLEAQTVSQMVDHILAQPQDQRWMLLAPVVNDRKGEHSQQHHQGPALRFSRLLPRSLPGPGSGQFHQGGVRFYKGCGAL